MYVDVISMKSVPDMLCLTIGLVFRLVQRTVTERPFIPWWNRDIGEIKFQIHLLERIWRSSITDIILYTVVLLYHSCILNRVFLSAYIPWPVIGDSNCFFRALTRGLICT